MKKNKKSQMEIMGLALVVILISLGLLFAIKFSAMKPATSGARKTYIKTIKAANMLNTLLKVDTGCAGASVTQLIQDCADTNPQLDCSGDNSCTYVKDTIEYIFDNSLEEWGSTEEDYYFVVKKGDIKIEDIGTFNTNPCPSVKESKNQPIPIPRGLVTVTLELCG